MSKTQSARHSPQATRKGMNIPVEVPLPQSCPSGLTKGDLEYLFSPDTLSRFYKWMAGQTCMLCNGKQFHYVRSHGEYCMKVHGLYNEPPHRKNDSFTWACDYAPGGWYEATSCSGLPEGTRVDQDTELTGHGMITYVSDVERFILGLPVVD